MSFGEKKQKLVLAEARNNYGHNWLVPLTGTLSHKPGFFCYAMFCGWCASYTNRKDALRGDMRRYICCMGHWPCSGKMKEQDCPEFCLCLEVYCCFAQSVASTRWHLQDELHIKNTKCDNCIIQTMVALQFLSCICSIVACLTQNEAIDEAANLVDLIAECVFCVVCGCMQTQAKIQMTEDQRWVAGGGQQAAYAAPQQQHMQYGAPGGYPAPNQPPPQAQMGYNSGYPVQQPPGYPAQQPPGYPAPQQGYSPYQ